jgi:putative flippase GtrA
MARLVADLYDRVRHLIPELAKFGIVGGIGTVVDLGGAAVLHSSYRMEPLTAKAISISAATVVTYLGSRFWTFRHRENQPLMREGMLFFALNVVGLLIAEVVIAATTYTFGLKDPIAYNIASLAGTGLGTIFRYFAYRKWVFLAPATAAAQASAVPQEFPGYAPWEPARWEPAPAPAYSAPASAYSAPAAAYSAWQPAQPRQVRVQNSVFPNGTVAPPLATASASGWPAQPPSRSAPRSAPAGSRAPGRHRKTH